MVKLGEISPVHESCSTHDGYSDDAQKPFQNAEPGTSFYDKFVVVPGNSVNLAEVDPSYRDCYESRAVAAPQTKALLHRLEELQYLMHSEKRHSLLIVIQGLDASGKDGVIRHMLHGMNPAGCHVVAFRQPRREELDHDFLWRVHPHIPAKGEISIFNRSHYEDVLVVRVRELAEVSVWGKRYELINDFERLLALENNTTVLKFFLHISKDEQLARFHERLEDPSKHWKISEADYKEREYWDCYIEAFEDMLNRTSTAHAPWFVIPSNCKWFRDLAISEIIVRTLEDMDMISPEPAVNISDIRRRYHLGD
jgi:PPK2 family polyphosphate:nucleotide phosphotransferase